MHRPAAAVLLTTLAMTTTTLTPRTARADGPASTPATPATPTTPTPAPAQPAPPGAPDARDPGAKRDVTHYNLPKPGKDGVALGLKGYDPVSYFPEGGGKPAKGGEKITFVYRGVTYLFATAAHRDLFKADPAKYEPAYGGWCASAMADGGRKVDIDPKAYTLTGGRLFLFYTDLFTDARSYWTKDEPKNTRSADKEWKSLTGEDPRAPKPATSTTPAPGAGSDGKDRGTKPDSKAGAGQSGDSGSEP